MIATKRPQVRTNETPAYFDVDETLIEKRPKCTRGFGLKLNYYGTTRYARPIKQHVAFLKACKARGCEITVWSANGYAWAKHVVEMLDLNDYVDFVCTKPQFYVDDKRADKWTKQVFIGDNE